MAANQAPLTAHSFEAYEFLRLAEPIVAYYFPRELLPTRSSHSSEHLSHLIDSISQTKTAVGALMKVHSLGTADAAGNTQFNVAIVGTVFCVVANSIFLTANHVFNDGQPRDRGDKFFVLTENGGSVIYHFPVTTFILEEVSLDMALIEAPVPTHIPWRISALQVDTRQRPAGTRVLTIGYPAPAIAHGQVDNAGNWGGGTMLLKSHASEGIVANSQFSITPPEYEFNVAWHHGESGGPIIAQEDNGVIGLMQGYRNVAGPHGMMAGPRISRALTAIATEVRNVGASVL